MADNTITQGELAYELDQMGYVSGHDSFGRTGGFRVTNPDQVAEVIVNTVLTRREQPYDNGCVYSDAQGEFWVYDHEHKGWYAFADTNSYGFLTPRRPLTKLVPFEPLPVYGEEVLREP